jgi:sensor c-di-GMP phosphodiesterase-like protein
MVTVVRALTRRKIIAIAVGALIAGAPLLVLNFWLNEFLDQQGRKEVDFSAGRAIALAESRVAHVIDALDELAAGGVGFCRPGDLDAMRQAAFRTIPIKEISVVAPDGNTLCTHLGLPVAERTVLSSEPLAGTHGYTIDVVQLASHRRAVRLRRGVAEAPNAIAATVPAVLFLPELSSEGSPFDAFAHIATRGGAPIAQTGEWPDGHDGKFAAAATSGRYGFRVEVAMPRDAVVASHAGLERLAMVATLSIVLVLGAALLLVLRRNPDNPVTEIERALMAGEFVPYYQPIVDIRSGQLRGAEVLVRWRKPDGILVLPSSFIPLAESSGLIRDMTRDLMRKVCAEVGEAIGSRPGLKVSFNFAGRLFADDTIVKDVRDIFSASPIKLRQVVLEVTERDPIENFTVTRQIVAALQGLGVRIAIDDVGTGHSGLSYMLKLGVDVIKIDKMFVDAVGTDRNSTTIVETLVDLAHNMRMDVVAEGVENFEQVVHLRDLGVRMAQGYVFAPPLPGGAFLQLVEAIDPLPAGPAARRDAA